MWKFLVITFVSISLVLAADPLLQKHLGTNYPVADFPSDSLYSTCSTLTLIKQISRCSCPNESGTIPLVKSTYDGTSTYWPIISVVKYSAVASALDQTCDCSSFGAVQPLVLRYLDETYAIVYQNDTDSDGKYVGTLIAKNEPTLSELESYMSKVEELADRTNDVVCISD